MNATIKVPGTTFSFTWGEDGKMPEALAQLKSTIQDILIRYAPSSRISYLQVWNQWCKEVNPLKATALDANRYIDRFKTTPITRDNCKFKGLVPSKRTIQRHVMILFSIYNQLSDLVPHNPFGALKRDWSNIQATPRRPTGYIEPEKVLRLIREPLTRGPLGMRDACCMALLFGAGLRISEAQNLNIEDVIKKPNTTVLILRDSKDGSDHEQPLPKWAANILEEYMLRLPKRGPLFQEFDAYGVPRGNRTNRSTLYKRFKFWAEKIGLPDNISPHAARATAITQLLDAGFTHRQVREFSRHKSTAMVELYDKRRSDVQEHPGNFLSYEKNILPQNKIRGNQGETE